MQEVLARKAIAEADRQYVIIKSQADVESARNFAEAARILSGTPGAMELRRLEALQNLTAQGTSKVIFDLAKPFDDHRGLAAAAAMSDDRTGVRVENLPAAGAQGAVGSQGLATQAAPAAVVPFSATLNTPR